MIPLGQLLCELTPGLLVPLGMDVVPRVSPEVLARALGHAAGVVTVFTRRRHGRSRFREGAFTTLERRSLAKLDVERADGRRLRRRAAGRGAGRQRRGRPVRAVGLPRRARSQAAAAGQVSGDRMARPHVREFLERVRAAARRRRRAARRRADPARGRRALGGRARRRDASSWSRSTTRARPCCRRWSCRPPRARARARRARARGRPPRRAVPRPSARRAVVGQRSRSAAGSSTPRSRWSASR